MALKDKLKAFRRRARPDTYEAYEQRRALRGYTAIGQEMDPTPMAPPIGYKKQPSMVDTIRAMIREEQFKRDLDAQGVETFDEADDFGPDEDEDYLPLSGYESEFDPPGVKAAKERFESELQRAKDHVRDKEAAATPPPPEPA